MRKNNKGAITIIFLMILALVLTLIMAATHSRVLLSLSRNRSAADILVATYQAESEANDIMAKLVGGYLDNANINETKTVGDMKIEITGEELNGTQIVTVTAFRGLAVGKVQAVRRLLSVEEVEEVEIVLMLDCTTSMDQSSDNPLDNRETRFEAQENAAIAFIQSVAAQPDADKFKLGVGVFGTSSAWLHYNGTPATPESGFNFLELTNAVRDGFGRTRSQSQCGRTGPGYVEDATSVGTAFKHAHDYLRTSKKEGTKQIEIVITDGHPNTRIADSNCFPGTACLYSASDPNRCIPQAENYLRCNVADANTNVVEINSTQMGTRDPDVDAYSVTVLPNPDPDVPGIFQKYGTEGGYFNATRASQLSEILDNILGRILEDRSSITLKRIIPTPQ